MAYFEGTIFGYLQARALFLQTAALLNSYFILKPMRKLNVALLFATTCFLLLPFLGLAQTAEDIQQDYLSYLKTEGYEAWVDSDGDVQFKHNDRTYFIEVNEGDPEFFRLVLANIWPIESVTEATQVVHAVDVVNRQMKVTKAYVTNDNVWVATELFIESYRDYRPVFPRCLRAIEQGVDTFVEEM